jgi:hypothetical protein
MTKFPAIDKTCQAWQDGADVNREWTFGKFGALILSQLHYTNFIMAY